MVWPSLWQYGALPAGGSWQLQERSLPGGSSEVLRQVWSSYYLDYVCLICCFQLHVLNEKFKNKEWTLKLIFIGHFCGVKDWDLPFSVQISEVRKWKGSRFLHILSPWTSATQQLRTLSWMLNWEHWNIELEAQLRTYEHWYSNLWTWVLRSKKGSALWMPEEYYELEAR